jgi:hypothetical protein
MKISYAIGHWIFTLLGTPFISYIIEYIQKESSQEGFGLLEIYPFLVLFSMAFSVPAFFFYLICFFLLSSKSISLIISKFILIAVSVVGIVITVWVILKRIDESLIVPYSITSVITGIVLRISDTKKQDQKAGMQILNEENLQS